MHGIVLRTTAYRDKDVILQVLSDSHGKIPVFGRRNKTNRKQSASSIEPLDWGEFELSPKKGDLYELKFYKSLSSFPKIRDSLSKLSLASFMCEICDSLLAEENHEDIVVYHELNIAFKSLVANKDLKSELKTTYGFSHYLLVYSGLLSSNDHTKASLKNFQKLVAIIQAQAERRLKTISAIDMLLSSL